ncbi:ligand-binding protein SH3 [Janibacter sp. Soil728]|uniref:DMT family transporter n=1 Tax=Janibacter sp. Soil728 TaxID=1736393 RepID=UPI000701977B|nr:multidrug efflux SMR transporter [Janibacter sp. Soil728]KRE37687.1 ligand-binding protein SH3 [Janibacter sp. Soil728]
MPWVVLLGSAVLEAVWATALGQSDGFSNPVATLVFFIALALSMGGLGFAVRTIPISTGYAIWTGVGAALTVTWAMATGDEVFSPTKALLLAGIVAAVIGLKLVPSGDPRRT